MNKASQEELEMLIEVAYMPVALKNNRYNGKDFLTVAFSLMDYLNRENPNFDRQVSAKIMVDYFNGLLNPKMNHMQYTGFVKYLSEGKREVLNYM